MRGPIFGAIFTLAYHGALPVFYDDLVRGRLLPTRKPSPIRDAELIRAARPQSLKLSASPWGVLTAEDGQQGKYAGSLRAEDTASNPSEAYSTYVASNEVYQEFVLMMPTTHTVYDGKTQTVYPACHTNDIVSAGADDDTTTNPSCTGVPFQENSTDVEKMQQVALLALHTSCLSCPMATEIDMNIDGSLACDLQLTASTTPSNPPFSSARHSTWSTWSSLLLNFRTASSNVRSESSYATDSSNRQPKITTVFQSELHVSDVTRYHQEYMIVVSIPFTSFEYKKFHMKLDNCRFEPNVPTKNRSTNATSHDGDYDEDVREFLHTAVTSSSYWSWSTISNSTSTNTQQQEATTVAATKFSLCVIPISIDVQVQDPVKLKLVQKIQELLEKYEYYTAYLFFMVVVTLGLFCVNVYTAVQFCKCISLSTSKVSSCSWNGTSWSVIWKSFLPWINHENYTRIQVMVNDFLVNGFKMIRSWVGHAFVKLAHWCRRIWKLYEPIERFGMQVHEPFLCAIEEIRRWLFSADSRKRGMHVILSVLQLFFGNWVLRMMCREMMSNTFIVMDSRSNDDKENKKHVVAAPGVKQLGQCASPGEGLCEIRIPGRGGECDASLEESSSSFSCSLSPSVLSNNSISKAFRGRCRRNKHLRRNEGATGSADNSEVIGTDDDSCPSAFAATASTCSRKNFSVSPRIKDQTEQDDRSLHKTRVALVPIDDDVVDGGNGDVVLEISKKREKSNGESSNRKTTESSALTILDISYISNSNDSLGSVEVSQLSSVISPSVSTSVLISPPVLDIRSSPLEAASGETSKLCSTEEFSPIRRGPIFTASIHPSIHRSRSKEGVTTPPSSPLDNDRHLSRGLSFLEDYW